MTSGVSCREEQLLVQIYNNCVQMPVVCDVSIVVLSRRTNVTLRYVTLRYDISAFNSNMLMTAIVQAIKVIY